MEQHKAGRWKLLVKQNELQSRATACFSRSCCSPNRINALVNTTGGGDDSVQMRSCTVRVLVPNNDKGSTAHVHVTGSVSALGMLSQMHALHCLPSVTISGALRWEQQDFMQN